MCVRVRQSSCCVICFQFVSNLRHSPKEASRFFGRNVCKFPNRPHQLVIVPVWTVSMPDYSSRSNNRLWNDVQRRCSVRRTCSCVPAVTDASSSGNCVTRSTTAQIAPTKISNFAVCTSCRVFEVDRFQWFADFFLEGGAITVHN